MQQAEISSCLHQRVNGKKLEVVVNNNAVTKHNKDIGLIPGNDR